MVVSSLPKLLVVKQPVLLTVLVGHAMKECTGEAKEKEGEFDEMANSSGAAQKDFIFIRLPVLREVSANLMCVWHHGSTFALYIHTRIFDVVVFGVRASH